MRRILSAQATPGHETTAPQSSGKYSSVVMIGDRLAFMDVRILLIEHIE
ncbi:hypothetical protein ADIMK_4068 [Marinobacterium lacunae]|uniref:Uncharacterized protein n=1 Tax=Marinobacterium lacunae TaxID=1232683 RepID=A0A081FTR6_9GAMM|nr:hypothetical protein ADIMK_4068 [Marinobacterium lacunae]